MDRSVVVYARSGALRLLGVLLAVGLAPAPAAGQEQLQGILLEIWGDPTPASPEPPMLDYVLVDEEGTWHLLELDEATLPEARQNVSRDDRRVVVSGGTLPQQIVARGEGGMARFRATSIEPLAPGPAGAPSAAAVVEGVQRYVTILCRFAGSVDAEDARDLATYRLWLGDVFPGMGDYWDELSRGAVDFDGTRVVGWYELPGGISHYFADPAPDERRRPDLGLLANDCAAQADVDVDFGDVRGINLQFNVRFGFSWGGGSVLTLDGPARWVGTTWMASWAGQSVYGHEVGHSFGLPHSSGPYGETYDSQWDVMSSAYVFWDTGLETWLGQHTNVFHRDHLGWIQPEEKVVADQFGTSRAVTLGAWTDPPGSDPVMVSVPLGGGRLYVAATRPRQGYDAGLPHSGIVIHEVDPSRGRWAQVVDPDGNGDPNDEGAVWIPGEAFHDPVHGVTLAVGEPEGGASPLGAGGLPVEVTRGWILDVAVEGDGEATVEYGSEILECASVCRTVFSEPVALSLTAVPAEGSAFGGWTGSCGGTDSCGLTLNENRSVGATFLVELAVASEAVRPFALLGSGHEDALTATGGTGSYTWTLVDGALPPGLGLDEATGVVSGTPTADGDFEFTFQVESGPLAAERAFSMKVWVPVQIESPPERPYALVDEAYEDALVASGGTGEFAWTLTGGTLPDGLELDGATGVVSGVPLETGSYSYTLTAESGPLSGSATLTLPVWSPVTVEGEGDRPPGTVGAEYVNGLVATGGAGTEEYVWSLSGGALPDGLELQSQTGTVSGIPRATGVFPFEVTATSGPLDASTSFSITVDAPVLTREAVLDDLLGGEVLTEAERRYLDIVGNDNGRLDVGDVLLFLTGGDA